MCKKNIFIIIFLMLFVLPISVSASSHVITIKGEPRTPDNKIDLIYDAGVYGEQGKITSEVIIDNEKGTFEIKDYIFDDTIIVNGMPLTNSVNIGVMGSCFYHSYNIKWQNNQYEISDASDPEKGIILATKENIIDLGILKEDKSNSIMVDSDVGISFQAFDMNGKEVAFNTAYRKFAGMSDVFGSKSRYKILIGTENGKKWEKTVATGAYCEGTRIIKRGSNFIIETNPNNSFPPIGFFRDIWLSILGFRMIVIIPLAAILFLIIFLLFFVLIKKKSSK